MKCELCVFCSKLSESRNQTSGSFILFQTSCCYYYVKMKLFCFSVASESSLEILTDILDDFNTKLCRLLRIGVDNAALNGRTGFPVSRIGCTSCLDTYSVKTEMKLSL